MENLTPNTRTTPDRDTDQTLQPIQAIFAFRFAVKKIAQHHHGPIRKAVGRGLLTSLCQSNRTNPNPTGSRVSRNSARRVSESRRRLRSAAPEQNKPKPHWQPRIAQLSPQGLQINTPSPACGPRTEQTQTRPSEIQVKPKSIKNESSSPPQVTRTEQTQVPPPVANCATQTEGKAEIGRFFQLCAARTEQTQAPKPSSKASGETY